MSDEKPSKNKSTFSWEVQRLRFTAFPLSNEISTNGDLLWKNIKEFELERREDNPKLGEKVWIGSKKEQKLILKVHLVKIDLILEPKEPILISPPELNMLGDLEPSVDTFKKIIDQFLNKSESLPNLTRIAFGASLFKSVSDREEGYQILSKLLPFTIDSKNTYDFNLQINKPTKSSTLNGLLINRLTKWGVLNAKAELVSSANPDNIVHFSEKWLNHLELDINTDKDHTDSFDPKKINDLFRELVNKGLDIAKTGLPK